MRFYSSGASLLARRAAAVLTAALAVTYGVHPLPTSANSYEQSQLLALLRSGEATPLAAASGDFNSDGRLDAVATFDSANGPMLAIYPGGSDAYFGAPSVFSIP